MSRSARALVVGAGPAAAYAVQACKDLGLRCTVVSNTQPNTEQAGAFFLHWLPDSLPAQAHKVAVSAEGTEQQYLSKQWPELAGRLLPSSSFPSVPETRLWYKSTELARVWEHQPVVKLLAPLSDHDLQHAGYDHSWVFYTFPTRASLQSRQQVRFPALTLPSANPSKLSVLYDGTPRAVVRVTTAWGRLSVEFPHGYDPKPEEHVGTFADVPQLVWLRDIHPDTAPMTPKEFPWKNVLPVGRYATWERHYLSHDAYGTVWQAVTGRQHPYWEASHEQLTEA